MAKKIITILGMMVMCMLLFTSNSYAEETENINNKIINIDEVSKNVDQNTITDVLMDCYGISLFNESGDEFENNNGPSLATKNMLYSTLYATIDNPNDSDWYEVVIGDTSHPYSFILTDIPSGCDYDMYLVTYDDTNGLEMQYYDLKNDNESEAFYLNFYNTGTYYIVVQPKLGYSDTNYSDEQYKLYMGNFYKKGTYGYVSTGISAKFGYVADSNTTYKYSNIYSYNLTNNTNIPNGATVTEIRLTSSGNSAHWLNFYKIISSSSGGISETKLGTIDVMYSETSNVQVKQVWNIQGKLLASNNFIWQPLIQFSYRYPIVLENEQYW